MDFSKLTAWFEKKPPYILALGLASGALLFMPTTIKSSLGLHGFVETQKGWVGVTFILSCSLLISLAGFSIYDRLKKHLDTQKSVRNFISELDNLSPSEKGVLKYFIDQDEKTLSLLMQDQAVNSLEKRGMIVKGLAGNMHLFPYMLQPCIFYHLKSHPEKLVGAKDYLGMADEIF